MATSVIKFPDTTANGVNRTWKHLVLIGSVAVATVGAYGWLQTQVSAVAERQAAHSREVAEVRFATKADVAELSARVQGLSSDIARLRESLIDLTAAYREAESRHHPRR